MLMRAMLAGAAITRGLEDLLGLFDRTAWPAAVMEPAGARAAAQGIGADVNVRTRSIRR
jgi:hypothetical protein